MFARIRVKNRAEREAITIAMKRPDVRAFVLVMGNLEQLSSDRARERVLRFVDDHFAEQEALSVFRQSADRAEATRSHPI